MPTQDEISQQLKLLDTYRQTLSHYFLQVAIVGYAQASPVLIHGIRDARGNISRIKIILRKWNVVIQDHPDDSEGTPARTPIFSGINPTKPEYAHVFLPKRLARELMKKLEVISKTEHSVIEKCLVDSKMHALKKTRKDLCQLDALQRTTRCSSTNCWKEDYCKSHIHSFIRDIRHPPFCMDGGRISLRITPVL